MRLGGGIKSNYSVSAFHIYPDCSLQQFLILHTNNYKPLCLLQVPILKKSINGAHSVAT